MTLKKRKHSLEEAWLRRRGYRHFDDVRAGSDSNSLTFHPSDVAKHPFFPFIGKTKAERRYVRKTASVISKKRNLCYAAHKDARIYAYYSDILSKRYETLLTSRAIDNCVSAYRKHPDKFNNIHFAKEAFDDISSRESCDVIAADVSDFFGSMVHARLKQRLCDLLCTDRLPSDYFALFKSLTNYRVVELDLLLKELGITRASLSKDSIPGKRADRLGSIVDIRKALKKPGLVERNENLHGIPQGSPISAVLSNIYMFEADTRLTAFAESISGLYRRYSDDILLVVPQGMLDVAAKELDDVLNEEGLVSNPEKRSVSKFKSVDDSLQCDSPLTYLGFEFDGNVTLLRQRSLARFHQRMTRAVLKSYRAAKARGLKRMNRQTLFERYSHLGSRNFIAYAKRASEIFYPDQGNSSPIRRQIRNHWRLLNARISKAESRL